EEKEADIQREAAELSATYGSMHPRMENIKAQQRDTRAKIQTEIGKIVSSVRNAALTADARYQALNARLESAKSEVSQSNVDSVDLRQLQREAEASQALLANFLERYKRSTAQETYQQTNAWIISPAIAPLRPSFPPTAPILAGALLAGLLIGALLVLFIEMLDRTFRTGDDVAKTTGLPSLALIPTFKKSELTGNHTHDPTSPFSEAIHKLHMRLLFSHDGESPRVTMFTSAAPDEGKTHISVSLARRLAHVGRRVIIVDGDLRRPSVHALLGARNGAGLIDLLNGKATPDETVYRDPASGVHAIFAGRVRKGENHLPDVSRLRMLLSSLAKHYDTVILDAPPILAGAEVIHYSRLVDTTVFVVRWGRTKKEVVLDGLHQLVSADARIAGVALSQVNPKKYKRYAAVSLHYRYPPRHGLAGGLS
ncbi:GNVR domain-containing protein, partial [Parvibaculum sp.]|uniref:polysaccharide biosynthesis tyrosine autokinase n=1 Tax=Parvibaculum sp. TaxID=2024848 RepID=UPI0034A02401